MTNRIIATLVGATLVSATVLAQQKPPARNISPKRHPNLAAAQRLVDQAFNRITMAQKANEWDLQGHAEKAKNLIDQASAELKMAAQASNAR